MRVCGGNTASRRAAKEAPAHSSKGEKGDAGAYTWLAGRIRESQRAFTPILQTAVLTLGYMADRTLDREGWPRRASMPCMVNKNDAGDGEDTPRVVNAGGERGG